MIRATRPEAAQLLGPRRVGERDRLLRRVEVPDDATVGRDRAAQVREDLGNGGFAIGDDGLHGGAAEARAIGAPLVRLDELPHLIDGADAAQVAFLLRRAPGEETVAAEDDAVAAR